MFGLKRLFGFVVPLIPLRLLEVVVLEVALMGIVEEARIVEFDGL